MKWCVEKHFNNRCGSAQCHVTHDNLNPSPQSPSHRGKRQQQELITELRRRQGKDSRHVYEGKDGAIEDIITGKQRTTGEHAGTSPDVSSPASCDQVFPLLCLMDRFLSPAALKTVPFTARSAKRSSRFFCDPTHPEEHY